MRYHIKEGSTVRELTKKRDLAKTARLSSRKGGGVVQQMFACCARPEHCANSLGKHAIDAKRKYEETVTCVP